VNDFYYAEIGEKALVMFIVPNLTAEDMYVNTLLDGAKELGVNRILYLQRGRRSPFDRKDLSAVPTAWCIYVRN